MVSHQDGRVQQHIHLSNEVCRIYDLCTEGSQLAVRYRIHADEMKMCIYQASSEDPLINFVSFNNLFQPPDI